MESQSNNRLPEDQDSKSSSEEELEAEDHVNDGARRSYECVFCKRGFTTAQALGGHMNIHRKERSAKPIRPSSAPTSINAPEDHDQQLNHAAVMRSLRSIQSYTGPNFAASPEVDYRTYIPAPMWVVRPAHEEFYGRNNYPVVPRHLKNLFATDEEHDQGWRSGSGLSLGIGPPPSSSHDDDTADGDEEHRNREMKVNNGGCSEGDIWIGFGASTWSRSLVLIN